jgi:hypothetical protein
MKWRIWVVAFPQSEFCAGVFSLKCVQTSIFFYPTINSIEGLIISCHLNAPGSWHDSCVACPMYENFHMCTPDEFYLASDTAFPWWTDWIHEWICAPMKEGTQLPADPINHMELLTFDHHASVLLTDSCSMSFLTCKCHFN